MRDYQEWTGSVIARVHSFRVWVDRVVILMTTTNNSSGKAQLFFTNYVINGKQISEGAGADETLPTVTRPPKRYSEMRRVAARPMARY